MHDKRENRKAHRTVERPVGLVLHDIETILDIQRGRS